jgi:hypothetical protein
MVTPFLFLDRRRHCRLQLQFFAEAEELQDELRARLWARRAEALCGIVLFRYGPVTKAGAALRQSSLLVLQTIPRQR